MVIFKSGLSTPLTETAYDPDHYPNLMVQVYALEYYKKKADGDEYSSKIRESKTRDLSDFFYPRMQAAFRQSLQQTGITLICVVPSSTVGGFSPTMLTIASRLTAEFGLTSKNLLRRKIKIQKKMAFLTTAPQRYAAINGTLELIDRPGPSEKVILLLDDIKTSGTTMLECTKLLKEAGAQEVIGLCLGINK